MSKAGKAHIYLTTTTNPGETIQVYSNERGWPIKTIRTVGSESVTTEVSYDALGRTQEVKVNNTVVHQANSYFGTTGIATSVTAEGVTTTTSVSNGYVPKLGDINVSVNGAPLTITRQTDNLGRLVKGEMDGYGVVDYAYNTAAGLLTQITKTVNVPDPQSKATEVQPILSFTPALDQGMASSVFEHRTGTTQAVTDDAAGLSRTVQVTRGTESIERQVRTAIQTGGSKGYLFDEFTSGGAETVLQRYSALGENLGGRYGNQGLMAEASQRDARGYMNGMQGALNVNIQRDVLGRVTGGDVGGQGAMTFGYDARDRLVDMTTPRNQPVDFNYATETDPSRVQILRGGSPVADYRNPLAGNTTSTLGAQTDQTVDASQELGAKITLAANRNDANDAFNTIVETDPDSGLLSRIAMPEGVSLDIVRDDLGMPQSVTFDGKTYTITDQGNNTYLIDGPGDEDVTVGFDIFGQIARYERGEEKTQISRDADGRPVKIVASGETTTIDYSAANPNLPSRIQVGENSLEMNNINGQGLPEEVVVNHASGQVKLNASYHSNGTPQTVTATPAGGEETKTQYDEHGALVMLQRPMEDPIVYNRNQWGTVESMDYAGTNYPIFGSRNDLNWSLSNGVNLTLND